MDSFYRSNKDYSRVSSEVERSPRISDKNKQLVRRFTQRLVAEGISSARIKKYLIIVRNICYITARDFDELTVNDVQKVLATLNRRGLATWTVNDYKTGIKRMLRFVRGRPPGELFRELLKVNRKGPNKRPLTYSDLLTQDEVRLLVKVANNPMFKCLVALAYESAARPSELLTLTVGSVSFAEGYSRLSIRESKTFTRSVYAMDSDRYLKTWLTLHPDRDNRDAPLFPECYVRKYTGEFLQPESYNKALQRLANKAGITKRVYSYVLRHSRITHLLDEGWSEVMIKKLVGHSVDSASFKVYEHLGEKQVEEYILKQRTKEKTEQKAKGLVVEKVCTFCKTENGLDADFCVHCNRAISLKGLMQSQEKEKELLKMLTPDMIDRLVEKKVEEMLRSKVRQTVA